MLLCCHCAFGLDPSLDASQYAHTAWKVREGVPNGSVKAIAQTPDGYLWLGTEFGLLRFDGIQARAWEASTGEQLPSHFVRGLLAASDGRLWIGTDKGLASWKDGRIVLYAEFAGWDTSPLLEDREGTTWVSGAHPKHESRKLCSIRLDDTKCDGDDGRHDLNVVSAYQDAKGNVWAGGTSGLWRVKPGPPTHYPLAEVVVSLIEGDNGALLISTPSGISQLIDGTIEMRALAIDDATDYRKLFRDRDGGLWIGTLHAGLLHMHQGKTDVFSSSDGLSGDSVISITEDREGSIWVATTDGLDRFRDLTIPTMTNKQGLSSNLAWAVLAAKDGSVWISTSTGLDRWKDGELTIYRKHAPGIRDTRGAVREIVDERLPDDEFRSLFEDVRGRVWASTPRGVVYFENGRFVPVPGVLAGRNVWSIAGDSAGNIWISGDDALFHVRPDATVERIPWSTLGHEREAVSLMADSARGGLWLGFREGGLAYWKDGRILRSFTTADGLGDGLVEGLRIDADGTLWVASESGLSRVKDGRIATLTSKNGLPCGTVHWSSEDDDRALWLGMACGVVSIARSELSNWVSDPRHTVRVRLFDASDGVRSRALTAQYSPQAARSADGRLWFVPGDGVSVIDPHHLPVNTLPPPVHVERVIADRKAYEPSTKLSLPPLVRDLQIDYTALSFVAPEKNRFRYKLEGRDRDWQDVGTRRQAFYGDLRPGNYRFRVIASNNSGVWNKEGALLDFSIAPAYWQTNWFRALCVVAFIGLVLVLYRLRVRQLAHQFNVTLEARVNERTRIARELHDTLLQSFHGLLLRFQTVLELLPGRAGEAKQLLASTIDQAADAITEGRDAVQGLRSSTLETNDLAVAIRTIGEEIAADEGGEDPAILRVEVQGAARTLHPIVRDEIYRIAGEALRNAFRHADAKQIEVELTYDARRVRLRVRDDGKGIDPTVLSQGGREGHFGLSGMRERAKLIGGKLAVWSALDSGTEIELTVPASQAYATTSSSSGSRVAEQRDG